MNLVWISTYIRVRLKQAQDLQLPEQAVGIRPGLEDVAQVRNLDLGLLAAVGEHAIEHMYPLIIVLKAFQLKSVLDLEVLPFIDWNLFVVFDLLGGKFASLDRGEPNRHRPVGLCDFAERQIKGDHLSEFKI